MKIFFCIVLIVFIILFIPIKIKNKIDFNFFKNKGFFSLYFYNLQLKLYTIKFVPFKFKLENKKEKVNLYLLPSFNGSNNFGDLFFNNLIKRIRIKSLKIISSVNIKDNCFYPYLICGGINIVTYSIFSIISFYKKIYHFECLNFANNTNTNFIVNLSFSAQINLFILLNCFLLSLFQFVKQK